MLFPSVPVVSYHPLSDGFASSCGTTTSYENFGSTIRYSVPIDNLGVPLISDVCIEIIACPLASEGTNPVIVSLLLTILVVYVTSLLNAMISS